MNAGSRRLRGGGGRDYRWILWALAIVGGAFIVGYVFTAIVFFPASDRPPVVAVPDLRELDERGARRVLGSVGLELSPGDTLPNARVAAGRILSQSPLPGQEVAPGSAVRVMVSGGPERRAVPVVTAMTREQAVSLLEATGFEVRVEEVEDPRTAGRVVGVEPGAGTELQVPAVVTLRVSSGPPLVGIPDLYGMTEAEAAAALASAGLELGEIEFSFAGIGAEELVIAQTPAAGDSLPVGSEVQLRMSTDRLFGGRRRP